MGEQVHAEVGYTIYHRTGERGQGSDSKYELQEQRNSMKGQGRVAKEILQER